MAIAFRSANSQAGTDVSTISVTKPTGLADGDVLIAVVAGRGGAVTYNVPTGFTLIPNCDQSDATGSAVASGKAFYKVVTSAAGEPASYAFTTTGGTQRYSAVVAAFSGVDNTSPIDASTSQNNTAASLNLLHPSVTAIVANTMLVALGGHRSGDVLTKAASMSLAAQNNGAAVSTIIAYEALTATGATGTRTSTASTTADDSKGFSVTLTPAGIPAVTDSDVFRRPGPVAYTPAGTTATTLVIPKPSTLVEGDLLLAYIICRGAQSINSSPTGWKDLDSTIGTPTLSILFQYLWAGPSEPANYTWGFSAATYAAGVIACFGNVDRIGRAFEGGTAFGYNPVGASVTAGTSFAVDPGLARVSGERVVMFAGIRADVTFTPPSGFTERIDQAIVTPNLLTITYADMAVTTPGAIGSKAFTASAAGDGYVDALILKPTHASKGWGLEIR